MLPTAVVMFCVLALGTCAPMVFQTDYGANAGCGAGNAAASSQWIGDGNCQTLGANSIKGTTSGTQVTFTFYTGTTTCSGAAAYGPTTCTVGNCCQQVPGTSTTASYQKLSWAGAVAAANRSVLPSWPLMVLLLLLPLVLLRRV